jgi:CheY-like chemotaxis protein
MADLNETSVQGDVDDLILKVLVADDHPVNQQVMRAVLPYFGCDATGATSGEAAVELASAAAFDLIIMDLHMPGIGGDEAARRIREGAGASRLAFIARWTTDTPLRLNGALYDAELEKPMLRARVGALVREARRRARNRLDEAGEPARGSRTARRPGGR